ncbi:MAG TPA: DUF2155 domain-containing protein [Pseudolabrys sp.]|jgi:hypothetical protein|nr:DUF2155 domain-containing protein [Pseudolabrys sp.]
MARLSFIVAASAAAFAAAPAFAQFGPIFNDGPPRPPADVPQRQAPPFPSRNFPTNNDRFPTDNDRMIRPPADIRPDVPPNEPLPAPMSLPPSNRPGGGSIQSQPLPALPGTAGPPQTGPLTPDTPQPAPAQRAAPGQVPAPGTRQSRGAPQQPSDTSVQPGDEVVVEPPPVKISNPTAVFSGLDKITGRIISFDVAINETVQFGALQVTPRVCYSRPPTETAQTDAFVEVDEVTLQGEVKRIFTGWMFAASPGLHAVEHPIYDVWLTDCKGGKNPAVAEAPPEPQPAAKPAARPPQPPQRRAPARPHQQGFTPALR